jgi:outer membrane lipoprotein SlyB
MTRLVYLAIPLSLLVAACTPTDQATAIGAVSGAALGAAVSSGSDRSKGIALGAIAGAVAGNLIARNNDGTCTYRDANGNTFKAACQ